MNTSPPSSSQKISGLEMSGALISRLMHELANQVSVLAGNVQLATRASEDAESTAKALRAMQQTSNAMGELMDRYISFRQQLENDAPLMPVKDFAALLAAHLEPRKKAGGENWRWRISSLDDVAGQMRAQPAWLFFVFDEIIAVSQSSEGQISFHPPGEKFDSRGLRSLSSALPTQRLLHISVRWPSEPSALNEHDLTRPQSLQSAVLVGLVRWMGGQISQVFLPPDDNRFWISLPWEEDAPA